MWELAVPHLPSLLIDFKGLARWQFYTSSCSFLYGDLYFQALPNTRKVRRSYFPHVSCVIWPSPDHAVHLAKLGFITRIPATLKLVSQVIGQALQGDTWQTFDDTIRYQPLPLCHYGMA